jgi:hypothetical protein
MIDPRRKERAMTNHLEKSDSPMQPARMQCGDWPALPRYAAVLRIGNGIERDRSVVAEESA